MFTAEHRRWSVGSVAGSRALAEVGFVVMWSSGFIGASLGTATASTPTLMAWRFLLAAGLLLGGVFLLRRGWPGPREVLVQSLVGCLAQVLYLIGVVGAVELGVAAGTAALVAALQPLLTAALSGPVLGERMRRRQWTGLVVSLFGVALVMEGSARVGGAASLWVYVMPFVGMAGLVAATLLQRRETLKAGPDVSLDVALAIQCATSALLFALLALVWGGLEPPGGVGFWVAIGWFVVLSTFVGYGFYWQALKVSGVARVSNLAYLTPPTTMVWAYLMLDESIGSLALTGLVICFGGVLVASARNGETRRQPTERRGQSDGQGDRGSLDVAGRLHRGANDRPGNPLGDGGDALFEWMRVNPEAYGTFDIAGGWGGRHPMGVPFFVLTHEAPDTDPGEGAYVTDGIESALEQAQAVAGEKPVALCAANVAQQFLHAGLLDEIQVSVAPVLLGGGVRLFDRQQTGPIEREQTLVVESDGVTHLRYRVVKQPAARFAPVRHPRQRARRPVPAGSAPANSGSTSCGSRVAASRRGRAPSARRWRRGRSPRRRRD
jgi:drug/metabolite transporter (DMT)-like permease/dihydrofolate reductase